MKKFLLAIVLIIFATIAVLKINKDSRDAKADADYKAIIESLPKDTSNSKKTNSTYVDGNEKALKEIRKENKVKEAINPGAGVLYVSVIDDGTSRNGYAEYLCQILSKNHSTMKRVKVMKLGSTNDPNKDNAYGVLLGSSDCN